MPSRSRSRSPHYGEIRSYDRRRRSRSPDKKPGTSRRSHSRSPKRRSRSPRYRSRSRSPGRRYRKRSRSRSGSPRRSKRSRSRSPRSRRHKDSRSDNYDKPKSSGRNSNVSLEGLDEEEKMMKLMGFSGFDSTKGKHVDGTNNAEGTRIQQKRRYRQYMNRRGGFNRPLDFIA